MIGRMIQPTTVVRQSPFIFIQRIVVAEFLFSVLLLLTTASTATESYESSGAGDVISFPLLLALIFTAVQVVIIVATFVSWYFPAYRLAPAAILRKSSPFAQERTLTETSTIGKVSIKEGWLARQLGYGSVSLFDRAGQEVAKLKNVHDPEIVANQVRGLMQDEPALPALFDAPPAALIATGEGDHVEFKASLMWDYRKQSVNKELYEPVMKNLVAFMNAEGGILLIGVADEGDILGLEPDMKTLRKPGVDGFENVFNVAFGNMVGMEYRPFVTLDFPTVQEKTICAIKVRPSTHPAYLRYQGKEDFYLRTGNSSNALTTSKAIQYIQSRFDRQ